MKKVVEARGWGYDDDTLETIGGYFDGFPMSTQEIFASEVLQKRKKDVLNALKQDGLTGEVFPKKWKLRITYELLEADPLLP